MIIQDLGLSGRHNVYKSLAAGIVANTYGLRKAQIRDSLSNFKSLEHRIESLGKFKGVEFINDSKSTNVNSAWFALEQMNRPVVWIAGGIDRGNDYSKIKNLVKEKVTAIIALGVDNTKIDNAFKESRIIMHVRSMKEAVMTAFQLADKGDCILLSPACASFDLFDNYEHRGKMFKQAFIDLQ